MTTANAARFIPALETSVLMYRELLSRRDAASPDRYFLQQRIAASQKRIEELRAEESRN